MMGITDRILNKDYGDPAYSQYLGGFVNGFNEVVSQIRRGNNPDRYEYKGETHQPLREDGYVDGWNRGIELSESIKEVEERR